MTFSYRSGILAILSLCISNVFCHMQMSDPCPLRSPLCSKPNGPVDYNYLTPLKTDGSDFSCKGYQWNTPLEPVETYYAGGTYNMSIKGGATHGGGSCQLALSYDNGVTFKVFKSMMGGCPMTSTYQFTIPDDAPSGKALFGWTWFNRIGNREMYMNCAVVTIINSREGSVGSSSRSANNAISRWPDLYVANLPSINNCRTEETIDPIFPEPGSDVVYGNDEIASSWERNRKSVRQCTGLGRRVASTAASSGVASSSWSSEGSGANSGQWNGGSKAAESGAEAEAEWEPMSTDTDTAYSKGQSQKQSWSQGADDGQWHPKGQKASSQEGSWSSVSTSTQSSYTNGQPEKQTWAQESDAGQWNSNGQTASQNEGQWRPTAQSSQPDDGQWHPNGQKAQPDDGQWHPDGAQTNSADRQWQPDNTESRSSFASPSVASNYDSPLPDVESRPYTETSTTATKPHYHFSDEEDGIYSGEGASRQAEEDEDEPNPLSNIDISDEPAVWEEEDEDAPNPLSDIDISDPTAVWEEEIEPTPDYTNSLDFDITDYLPELSDIPAILDDKGAFPDLTKPINLGENDILISSDDEDVDQRERLVSATSEIPACKIQDPETVYVRPPPEWFAANLAPEPPSRIKRNVDNPLPVRASANCQAPVWNCAGCNSPNRCIKINECTRICTRFPYRPRVAGPLFDTDEGYPGPLGFDTEEGYPGPVGYDSNEGYPNPVAPCRWDCQWRRWGIGGNGWVKGGNPIPRVWWHIPPKSIKSYLGFKKLLDMFGTPRVARSELVPREIEGSVEMPCGLSEDKSESNVLGENGEVKRPLSLPGIPPTTTVETATSSIVVASTASTSPTPAQEPPTACPSSPVPYATGDVTVFLPCQPGTTLCKSETEFYTCGQFSDGGWTYGALRPVSAGMKCQPNLVALGPPLDEGVGKGVEVTASEPVKEVTNATSSVTAKEEIQPTVTSSIVTAVLSINQADFLAALLPFLLAPGPLIPSDTATFPVVSTTTKETTDTTEIQAWETSDIDTSSSTFSSETSTTAPEASETPLPNASQEIDEATAPTNAPLAEVDSRIAKREECPIVPSGYYRDDLYVGL